MGISYERSKRPQNVGPLLLCPYGDVPHRVGLPLPSRLGNEALLCQSGTDFSIRPTLAAQAHDRVKYLLLGWVVHEFAFHRLPAVGRSTPAVSAFGHFGCLASNHAPTDHGSFVLSDDVKNLTHHVPSRFGLTPVDVGLGGGDDPCPGCSEPKDQALLKTEVPRQSVQSIHDERRHLAVLDSGRWLG